MRLAPKLTQSDGVNKMRSLRLIAVLTLSLAAAICLAQSSAERRPASLDSDSALVIPS
jgi:hypothetical protein